MNIFTMTSHNISNGFSMSSLSEQTVKRSTQREMKTTCVEVE